MFKTHCRKKKLSSQNRVLSYRLRFFGYTLSTPNLFPSFLYEDGIDRLKRDKFINVNTSSLFPRKPNRISFLRLDMLVRGGKRYSPKWTKRARFKLKGYVPFTSWRHIKGLEFHELNLNCSYCGMVLKKVTPLKNDLITAHSNKRLVSNKRLP